MAATNTGKRKLSHEQYTVGWVVVLEEELTAAIELLDGEDEPLPASEKDDNTYFLGKSGEHNVVITCTPTEGTTSAAHVVTNLLRTFPNIRLGLLVGIGGGAPKAPSKDPNKDIRLGDVVVSTPKRSHGGVFQYDKGRYEGEDDYQIQSHLNKPPNVLLGAVKLLATFHKLKRGKMKDYIREAVKTSTPFPGWSKDQLFKEDYEHKPGEDCTKCDSKMVLTRVNRPTEDPVVHHGLIASGNSLVRSSQRRDQLRDKWSVCCFEMEAAGLMDSFPCVVIRGISDYCDSHKNDIWHPYAAFTAAAYAKDLLGIIKAPDVEAEPPATERLTSPKSNDGSRASPQELHLLNDRLNVLEKHLQAQDARLSGNTHQRESAARLDEVERRLQTLDMRLSTITNEQNSTKSELKKLRDQLLELEKRIATGPSLKPNPGLSGRMMDPTDHGRIGVSEYGPVGRVEAGIGRITRRANGGPTRIRFQQRFDRIPHVQITPERFNGTGGFENFWIYLLRNGGSSVDRDGFDVGVFLATGHTVTFRWLAVEVLPG